MKEKKHDRQMYFIREKKLKKKKIKMEIKTKISIGN